MDKSTHLITLENLRSALSNFDMSFGVSNRLFRLAIVSEILDTACLFEQLFDAWSQRLPYGEGPDADVNFEYWKDIATWKELVVNAQQNLCIDTYPLDLGNGQSSEDIRGNRRKSYGKYLKTALKYAKYTDSQNVSEFARLIGNDKTGMMTFGHMVFNAVHSLHNVLGKIEVLLNNPPQELFNNYYDQQRERFADEIDQAMQKTKDIMHESIVEKRKVNRLKEMKDCIIDALRESGFLADLKTAYTHYDIEDYRDDNNCPNLPDDIVPENLVLEDLLTDDMQLDRKKIAKHIYEHRKTLSRDTIASFYIYAEVIPEIDRLLLVLKEYDIKSKHKDDEKSGFDKQQQEIVDKLKPIFYGDEENAKEFLMSIKGMKPTLITQKVNQLVKDKVISDISCKRDLWKVLHECGLYDKSESNWNQQVK